MDKPKPLLIVIFLYYKIMKAIKGAIILDILAYTMEELLDPTHLIEGERYEFVLEIAVDEEDELYTEGGLEIRLIVAKKGDEFSIANYFITAKAEEGLLDFALEEDEEKMILHFCQEHIITGE